MNKTMVGVTLVATLASLPAATQAQNAREEGPTQIEKCQTISQPGSYKLANNLTSTSSCLSITANFVSIDLAGFTISGPGGFPNFPTGIAAGNDTTGITVRTGRSQVSLPG